MTKKTEKTDKSGEATAVIKPITASKRLVLSASDKGGCGKSFFTIQLLQYLKEHPEEPKFRGFDPDHANRTLLAYHPDVASFIDVDKPNSIDECVRVLESADISVVDGLGSQAKRTFRSWAEEVNLFDIAPDLDLAVTYVCIVEEDRDTILQTKDALTATGDKVNWIIVKNFKQAKSLSLWEESATRKMAQELGAIEIELPKLAEHLAVFLTSRSMPVGIAAQCPEISILDRQRYITYWRNLKAELEKAEAYIL